MEGSDIIKNSTAGSGKDRDVCVIIPTYNRAPLIPQAIDSVLNQTFKDVVVMVIDDGSTDETEAILRQYDGKIEYVKQSRGGPGKARNAGLNRARSPYVAFLDSDDIWHKTKLETQVAILEKHPEIGFLFSEFCVLKENGVIIHQGLRRWHKEPIPWDAIFEKMEMFSSPVIGGQSENIEFAVYWGKNLYRWLLKGPYVLPTTTIMRRECIDEGVRFPEGVFLYEDWEFFARLTRHWQAGFMDVETAVNLGHDDGVRLTRRSALEAAINRMALIKRVWKSDPDFMKSSEDEVRCVEGDQILLMAKEFLLHLEFKKSRSMIRKWDKLGIKKNQAKVFVLKMLTYLPWGVKIILFLRKLRRMAQTAASGSMGRGR
jgi:glycosyltransferase involved in cell wall biosynthesis